MGSILPCLLLRLAVTPRRKGSADDSPKVVPNRHPLVLSTFLYLEKD